MKIYFSKIIIKIFLLIISIFVFSSSLLIAEKETKPVFQLTSDKIGNVFKFGDSPFLKLQTDVTKKGMTYIVQVTDFRGQTVHFYAETILNQVTPLILPKKEKGIFYVTAMLRDGTKPVAETKTSYAIITPIDNEIWKTDSVFSCQLFSEDNFTLEQIDNYTRLCRESGIKWNRQEISWDKLVSQKKVKNKKSLQEEWRWDLYDNVMIKSCSAGINNYVVLNGWRPAMFSTTPREKDIKPEHIKKYAEYCFQVIARYKPNGILAQKQGWKNYGVRVWQIWDDPSTSWLGTGEQYGKLYRAAYDAIKLADPDAVVMYSANANYVFNDEAINAAGLKKFDAIGLHVYCHLKTPEEGKVNTAIESQRKAFIDNKMGDVPFWLTKTDFSTDAENRSETELLYADYLVRSLVMELSAGLDKVCWNNSLVNIDSTPKAGYVAYNTLISQLYHKKFVGEIKKGKAIKCYIFAGETGSVAVVWSPKEKGTLQIISSKSGLKMYDIMNNEISSTIAGEKLNAEISDTPVYIVSLEKSETLAKLLSEGEVGGVNTLKVSIGEFEAQPDGNGIVSVQVVNTGEKIVNGKIAVESSEKWMFANTSLNFGPLKPGGKEEKKFEFTNFLLNTNNEYNIKIFAVTDQMDTAQAERVVSATIALKNTPQIDGDLVDWSTAVPVALKYPYQVTGINDWNESDLSAKTYFAWDDNNLYFAAAVKDNYHSQPYTKDLVWQGDNVQIALENYLYGFSLNDTIGQEVWLWQTSEIYNIGISSTVLLACKRDDDAKTTCYEAKIPKEALSLTEIMPGTKLSISLIINDNDGTRRRGGIELTPAISGEKVRSAEFRNLYLVE